MSNNILKDKFNRTLSTTPNDVDDEKAKKQTFIEFDKLFQSPISLKIFSVDDSLAPSITEDGLLTPFLVCRNKDKYEILSGNKRFEAFKSLVKNKDFKYKYMGNNLLDPKVDGLPCIIVERDLSDTEKKLYVIGANKHRDYDKLEIYRMVLAAKDSFAEDKENGLIKHGDGRAVTYIANRTPVSERTISDILTDTWTQINSRNIKAVEKCGSFEKYCEIEAGNQQVVKGVNDRVVKDNPFNKEYKYLDKIDVHHKKLDFDKLNLKGTEYDDLRENAVLTIKSIMNIYSISTNELK